MPAKRLSMRQVKEVLRLKWACGLSDRQIAQSLGISRPTVTQYVRRLKAAGLSWPLPENVDDAALESRLFANANPKHAELGDPLPTPIITERMLRPVVGLSSAEQLRWITTVWKVM